MIDNLNKVMQEGDEENRRKVIGQYIIGQAIGEGTFGKVRLGTHRLTEEKVAVKILEKARIKDVGDVERVTRELHILKLIRNPHIIQLYEVCSYIDYRNPDETVPNYGIREWG